MMPFWDKPWKLPCLVSFAPGPDLHERNRFIIEDRIHDEFVGFADRVRQLKVAILMQRIMIGPIINGSHHGLQHGSTTPFHREPFQMVGVTQGLVLPPQVNQMPLAQRNHWPIAPIIRAAMKRMLNIANDTDLGLPQCLQ
jgi:hypothetical protein